MDLFHDNAAVLELLPVLSTALLRQKPEVETIFDFLDLNRKSFSGEHYLKLRLQLMALRNTGLVDETLAELDIDTTKATVLAHTFGELYTPAIALATGAEFYVEVKTSEKLTDTELDQIIEHHLTTDPGTRVVTMKFPLAPLKSNISTTREQHAILELRRMLERVGVDVDLNTMEMQLQEREGPAERLHDNSELETPAAAIEFELVSLYTWFCTCQDYAAKTRKAHRFTGLQIVNGISETSENRFLLNYFRHLLCYHLVPLPVCVHLLAAVLVVANRDVVGMRPRVTEPRFLAIEDIVL